MVVHARPVPRLDFTRLRRTWHRRARLTSLRPGVVLALAVVSVVGSAGILTWDRRLLVLGLLAGCTIIAINVVVVLTRHWHRHNTQLDTSYGRAEDVLRLRRKNQAASTNKRR